jgi:hypothetical protein
MQLSMFICLADILWRARARGAGWIRVEATGSSNPLGWTPPDFENGGWTVYPIGCSAHC